MHLKSINDNKHVVDTLFVFLLFTIFTICAVFLIAFGANIYKRTITNFDEHYNLTTSVAYIQEKFRQCDEADSCVVVPFGESDALRITSYNNDIEYYTYIYEYDGCLKELYTKSDNQLSPKAGQNLLEINRLFIDNSQSGIFNITIIDSYLRSVTVTCSSKCDYN